MAHETAHRETGAAELPIVLQLVAPRDGHIVDNPVVLVVQTHALLQRQHAPVAVQIAADVASGACLRDKPYSIKQNQKKN